MKPKSSKKYDLLVQVAELYYMQKMTQQEIGEKLHVSRSNISKMLKKCLDIGIVEVKINNLSSASIDLQSKLKERFQMRDVILVPTEGSLSDIKSHVGEAAADYLAKNLRNHMVIGVSWGTTPYQVASHFNTSRIYDVDVVQLLGGMNSKCVDTDGQTLVKMLQQNFHGTGYVLQAPMIVKNIMLKQMLLEEPEIKKHFEKMKHIDIALLGIGSNHSNLSAIYKSGHIKKADADYLIKQGAISDICGTQIDINGNVCETDLNDRVIAIEMSRLLKVPIRIGVAAGLEKHEAILSVLRGKYINVLVTDEQTAKKVYEHSIET